MILKIKGTKRNSFTVFWDKWEAYLINLAN